MQPGGHMKSAGCIPCKFKGPDCEKRKNWCRCKSSIFQQHFLICTGYVSPSPRTHSVHKLTSRGTIFPLVALAFARPSRKPVCYRRTAIRSNWNTFIRTGSCSMKPLIKLTTKRWRFIYSDYESSAGGRRWFTISHQRNWWSASNFIDIKCVKVIWKKHQPSKYKSKVRLQCFETRWLLPSSFLLP